MEVGAANRQSLQLPERKTRILCGRSERLRMAPSRARLDKASDAETRLDQSTCQLVKICTPQAAKKRHLASVRKFRASATTAWGTAATTGNYYATIRQSMARSELLACLFAAKTPFTSNMQTLGASSLASRTSATITRIARGAQFWATWRLPALLESNKSYLFGPQTQDFSSHCAMMMMLQISTRKPIQTQ